ncbi:MAG: SapC family protein [Campylobacterales bacterium]|nr:SapC family protein [Campylobacterales bacterium]
MNKVEDKDITISPLKNYKHARNLTFMAVSRQELAEASKTLPLFFAKDGDGVTPIVILGVKDNENLFVNKSGEWEKNIYIPALIRSYPFVLSKQVDVYSLAYDVEYEGLNKKDGQKILDENGELNEYGKNVMNFVQNVYTDLEFTKNITKLLSDNELFKDINANIEKDGKKFVLSGLMQIDTDKLNTLSDDKLLILVKSGALNLVYSHLASLSNFKNLAENI